MPPLLQAGLSNAAAATVLALLAAFVGRVVHRPALSHALWLLVLLKLLTPPLIAVPVGCLPAEQEAIASGESTGGVRDEALLREPSMGAGLIEPPPPLVASPVPSDQRPESDSAVSRAMDEPPARAEPPGPLMPAPPSRPAMASSSSAAFPWGTIAAVWLTGSLLWFVAAGISILRFRRLLRYAMPASKNLRCQAADLARRLGLPRCPEIRLVPGTVSPLLWAFGRARLVLPRELLDRLSTEQRASLLAHELAHLRRRDHWVRVLELAVCCLYWWHPVVWWARQALREAEEQCCDAWVVGTLPAAGPAYAAALLETVDFLDRARPTLPAAASGIGQVHHLRRRLTMILRETPPRSLSSAGLLVVVGLGLVLLPLAPGRAQDKPAATDEPAQPAPQQQQEVTTIRKALADLRADIEERKAHLKKAQARLQDLEERLRKAELPSETSAKLYRLQMQENYYRTLLRAQRGKAVDSSDARLAEVEKQLDALLKEIQAIRKQRRTSKADLPSGDTVRRLKVLRDSEEVVRQGQPAELRRFIASGVRTATFAPDGRLVVSGGEDAAVRLWDVASGKEVRQLHGHEARVRGLAVSPDGKRVVSGSRAGDVRLWDLASGRMLVVVTGTAGPVNAVAFSPDGRLIAWAGADGSCQLHEASSGQVVRRLGAMEPTAAPASVNAVAFSPDGKRVAVGGADGTVRVLDVNNGELVGQLMAGSRGAVQQVCFSTDGEYLLVACDEGVRLWQEQRGQRPRIVWEIALDRATSAAFAADGRHIAVGGRDATVHICDAATGKEIAVLRGHAGPVWTVTFSPDGHQLLSGGDDGTLRLWSVPK
jgi:WD40 repeat protein/beta-lactamase regulating signal transducer with metallopeptidase domain